MVVMKFGGSSVANAERIKHVASIIQAYKDNKLKSKTLIKEAQALIKAKEKANKPKDKATA